VKFHQFSYICITTYYAHQKTANSKLIFTINMAYIYLVETFRFII
jgi:hypothetical protein